MWTTLPFRRMWLPVGERLCGRLFDGTGRTFVYSPLLTRERYVKFVLQDVRDTIFGSSVKKMLSFFVQHEEISDEELREILDMINGYD